MMIADRLIQNQKRKGDKTCELNVCMISEKRELHARQETAFGYGPRATFLSPKSCVNLH